MYILNQDRNFLWSTENLVNFGIEIVDGYQEEERVFNEDGDISVYVNYYPSKGILKANYNLNDGINPTILFEGDGNKTKEIFNNLIKTIKDGENFFEIPNESSELIPTTQLRYVKKQGTKKYIQVKKWAKYEKDHPLDNLRTQIVKVFDKE